MTFKCYKFNVDNAYTLYHIPYTQQGNKNSDSDVTSPRRQWVKKKEPINFYSIFISYTR